MSKKKSIKGVICKNGYWYARINGEEKYCGKAEKGRELAEIARKKWDVKQFENREVNAGLKVKRTELKTVTDLSNWYMMQPSIQEQAGYWRKVYAAKHLLNYFGNKRVNQIEGNDQERYREHRKSEGVIDTTVNLEIAFLGAMYNMDRKRKMIPADFVPGEFIRIGSTLPRRTVTEDEFEKLLNHAEPDFKDALICAYESAMRSSEICKLTAGQVHLDMKHFSGATLDYIDLGIFDTKTGARRTVPICHRLKSVLNRRMEGLDQDDYVFTNKGKKYYKVLITTHMKSTCEKAKVTYGDKPKNRKGERTGIVFHCFRHTRTSKWVEMGFSDEIIRRATGHRSLAAYQQYVKLDPHAVMGLVENPKRDKNATKTARSL